MPVDDGRMLSMFVLGTVLVVFARTGLSVAEMPVPSALSPLLWIEEKEHPQDSYVAFRGQFTLERENEAEIRTLGASWFVAWLDGRDWTEGPSRFPLKHPEYEVSRVKLSAGRHVLAFQVHHVGVSTRMLEAMPPFLYCQAILNGRPIPIEWKCRRLIGYRPAVRRINPELGWIEWCDTRQDPADWQRPEFDDKDWIVPMAVTVPLGSARPLSTGSVRHFEHPLRPIAEGRLAEFFGYEFDDVPARFFLRDQAADKVPPQGMWRRYDLGRVRLGVPRFTLDLPAGAVVEFAYNECLTHGRVSPYINLSAGPSCNLDHYVARGGVQEFRPLTPKGGRFLEVQIIAEPGKVRFVKEVFVERCYHDKPDGSFACGDPLIDKIWMTGIETYRACTEDAIIDNPTRERGQWTGDSCTVGIEIISVAYSDFRLLRRVLVHDAQCARADGLVGGLCPSDVGYLSTYSAQWATACVRYYQLTGDRALLEDLYPAALRNMSAFERFLTKDGLIDGAGWAFVDWGYVRNPGPADMGYNLHFLTAVRAMSDWSRLLGKQNDEARFVAMDQQVSRVVRAWLDGNLADGSSGWQRIGYHCTVLALWLGLIPPEKEAECLQAIRGHILRCFPNDPEAPRLSDPQITNQRIITPYFAHFAFPPLIERGGMDFVLDQYRKCWGWLLGDGRTTWLEVFDPRWSHCHHWSGPPTWQLSRYVLGLNPRFDLGKNHYEFNFHPGPLPTAKGRLPFPDGSGHISVEWRRDTSRIQYQLAADSPITLLMPAVKPGEHPSVVEIKDRYEMVLPPSLQ